MEENNNNALFNSTFDKRASFEEHCQPLLDQLILECRLLRIPFFWSAAVANDTEKTEYINDAVGTASYNLSLYDDKISKHLSVAAGFNTIPKREDLEVVMNTVSDEDDTVSEEDIYRKTVEGI